MELKESYLTLPESSPMPTYSSLFQAKKACACIYEPRCSGIVRVGNEYKLAIGLTFMPSTSNPKTDSWKRNTVTWEVRQGAVIMDDVKQTGSPTRSALFYVRDRYPSDFALWYAKNKCLDWFEGGGVTYSDGKYIIRRGTSFVDAPNSGETSYKMNVIYGDRW